MCGLPGSMLAFRMSFLSTGVCMDRAPRATATPVQETERGAGCRPEGDRQHAQPCGVGGAGLLYSGRGKPGLSELN